MYVETFNFCCVIDYLLPDRIIQGGGGHGEVRDKHLCFFFLVVVLHFLGV